MGKTVGKNVGILGKVQKKKNVTSSEKEKVTPKKGLLELALRELKSKMAKVEPFWSQNPSNLLQQYPRII